MAHKYDVFLSHSSADKPAVEEIARKLRDAGFKPFLDKWHLVPGQLWQPALEKGLRDSGSCAIFVGAEGFGPWHQQEMLVAVDRGAKDSEFPVIPVLLPGFKKPTEIPAFLSQRTWIEFSDLDDSDGFHRLISGIRGEEPDASGGGPSKRSRPYRNMAQPMEEGFVHRREYNEILEALCPKETSVQSGNSVGITTALRGAGGFGKTALAQKLCQDPRVREHYPDGILWTTMGENTSAESRISNILDLIRFWADIEPPAFRDPQAAGAKLRELLKGRHVLLVIDDVWNSADVIPFQGFDKGSTILITTRNSQTLPRGTKRIEVDAMASSEAVELLGAGLPKGGTNELQSLAALLGEWPLLLKLVNGQIRRLVEEGGLAPLEALREAKEALDSVGFSFFDQNDPVSRNAAASRTVLVSVQQLPVNEGGLYSQLNIFPEDEDIPLSVLERFWSLDRFRVQKLCENLLDLSLLLRFDPKNGTIRLHDVIRKVLIEQSGDTIPDLHRQFLASLQPASGSWSDLPIGETYLWLNIASHLIGAGEKGSLRSLLADFSFIEAKLKATDVNGLIADYEYLVEEEKSLRLVQDALRLSAHILVRDPRQLGSQLWGRLQSFEGADIQDLLFGAKASSSLRPRTRSLVSPGGYLIRTLEQSDSVTAIAVMDGRQIISGSDDGTLQVWDLETGETLRTLEGHSDKINVLAVVDNHRAVSGSDDGTLRVWDLETGETLRTLEGHSDGIKALAVVDGQRAISGSSDLTLRVWDLKTGETLRTLEGHSDEVRALALVDSHHVVSGSDDETVRVWDLETGETLHTLEGHSSEIEALAMVDDRRAVFGPDGILRVWDLETGEILQTLGHSGWVSALAVVDSRRAVSGSFDGRLRVWDLEVGETLRPEGHLDGVRALAVLDDQRAVSGSFDGTLRVWDLETGETLRTLKGHSAGIRALAVVDGRRVVSGSSDRTLRMWDLETGKTLRTFEGQVRGVTALLAVVDDRQVISGSSDRTLRVWDLETGKILRTFKGYAHGVTALLAVMDGRRVISRSSNRKLGIWDLETGETLHTLKEHPGRVTAWAGVDSRRAVSGSDDGTLQLWDLEVGASLRTFEGHSGWVRALAVVSGHRVVSGSSDGTLRVWDLETGEVLAVLTLDAPVLAVAVTPNGRIVVAGDQSGRVHFLDLVLPE